MSSEKYVKLPQPHELSEREKEDAMGAYLMMFAALATSLPLPIINLIAATVYYYVNRKKRKVYSFSLLTVATFSIANNDCQLGTVVLDTTNIFL